MVATIIYAMPPMVRVTRAGAARRARRRSSTSAGWPAARARQMIWRVLVPAARPPLMVGVNQVIMLSLNMVIIASMIGAGGLGFDVLAALRRLDIGAGLEAGLAIVVLAIALDRLSQAYARASRQRGAGRRRPPAHPARWRRSPLLVALGCSASPLPAVAHLSRSAGRSRPRRFWVGAGRVDQRQLLRHARGGQDGAPAQRAGAGQAAAAGLPWPWVVAAAWRSPAGSSAARGSPLIARRLRRSSSPSPATGRRRW